jgi:hypothetical protein
MLHKNTYSVRGGVIENKFAVLKALFNFNFKEVGAAAMGRNVV